ncbi:hypothetical protein HAR72_003168 [Salmonella enterica]|nr:hypothetical protein [Salmonella enterica subsp. enterica serovar Typhimurium]
MSAIDLTECSDNEKATNVIKETIKLLVGERRIHSRDDIIRHLCGAKFDIVDVTEESITICAPDEPVNTSTLSGWLFSDRFRLVQDRHRTEGELLISREGRHQCATKDE